MTTVIVNNKEHPLSILPNSAIAALLDEWCPSSSRKPPLDKGKIHAAMDAYLEIARPSFFRVFERLRGKAGWYTSSNFAAWHVTMANLVAEGKISIPELAHYGLVQTADDLQNLGVHSLDDVVAIAPPRKWKPMTDAIRGHNEIELTPVGWVTDPGKWKPQDLDVLGISLDVWFEKHPRLRQKAHNKAGEWFAKEKPERWAKYAGLKKFAPTTPVVPVSKSNTESLL